MGAPQHHAPPQAAPLNFLYPGSCLIQGSGLQDFECTTDWQKSDVTSVSVLLIFRQYFR